MSLEDALQYAAGFCDADGCITQTNHRGLVINFTNNDIRPLERIRNSLGFKGCMDKRYAIRSTKPRYMLFVSRQKEVIPLGRHLAPYLHQKQERLERWFLGELGEVTGVPRDINDRYVAGWIDGDGSVYENTIKNTKYNKTYTYWRITFYNTNLAALEMFQTYLEAGTIRVNKHTKERKRKKTVYALTIAKKIDVKRIANRLAPLCSTDKAALLHAASG